MSVRGKIILALTMILSFPLSGYADPEITLEPGKFEIKGDGIKVRIGGRLQADMAFYDPNPEDGALSNGGEIRRARLFMSGTVWDVWQFKAQFEFATGNDQVKDAYIRYTGLPVNITVGHLKTPFSLEEMSSSKHITFMERALPNVFAIGRGLGVGLTYQDNGLIVAGSLTNKLNEGGAGVNEGNDAINLTGRVVYDFLSDRKDQTGHVGFGISWRDYGGTENVRFRHRPESHVTDRRLLDTGIIQIDGRDARPENRISWGLEAALMQGPYSVQGEYIRTELEAGGYDDRNNADADDDVSVNNEYEFDGYYVEAGWIITGESRRYSNGVFTSPKPAGIVGKGGRGAWQIAARYSRLDFSDDNLASVAAAGIQDNITVGVNWWPTSNIRFAWNYIRADVDRNTGADPEVDIIQMRAQVEF